MSKNKPIKLYYYRNVHDPPGYGNFGDELSPLLVERLSGRSVEWAPIGRCDMIGIGSNLDLFCFRKPRDIMRLVRAMRGVDIWGAGFMHKRSYIRYSRLHFHLIRGYLSANRLHTTTRALGDPGLLANILLEKMPEKRFKVGLVPHRNDLSDPQWDYLLQVFPNSTLISTMGVALDILQEIAECEMIFSTALHPLIVADALGIPNFWCTIGDRVEGKEFKFLDYYSSHGIKDIKPLLLNEVIPGDEIFLDPLVENYERKFVSSVQKNIFDNFPYK